MAEMDATRSNDETVLVTGACGHIGRTVCRRLGELGIKFLAVDVSGESADEFLRCDLRRPDQISELFHCHAVRTVVHLAGILPSAFLADPLQGAEVNLAGTIHLMREAVKHGSKRFVFASSMSVYGSSSAPTPLSEDDPAQPDEPYGAAKRALELVGAALADHGTMEFISLRIARVVGAGIRRTSSPWRAEIFDSPSKRNPIRIPFGPDALVSLVHVEDVARMLVTLVTIERLRSGIYNTPAEIWRVGQLQEAIQKNLSVPVELNDNGAGGGPLCDGKRFAQEFGFQLRGLASRIGNN
jgi:nucleoside-diphosphate-sugar epimerase